MPPKYFDLDDSPDERLRNPERLDHVQTYLVALIEFLEREDMNHELNLTRAFREVVVQTDTLLNPS